MALRVNGHVKVLQKMRLRQLSCVGLYLFMHSNLVSDQKFNLLLKNEQCTFKGIRRKRLCNIMFCLYFQPIRHGSFSISKSIKQKAPHVTKVIIFIC